ncbi:MAG: class I SAM-dependent methyltransferase [Thermodesulfobacteriota bacterium]
MDLRILKEVNDLWARIYPYLASQVIEYYGRSRGDVLELGPFAGGISVELARMHPGFNFTIAAQDSIVVDFLRKEVEGAVSGPKMEFKRTELDNLIFPDSVFDLAIFRGAYFFLDGEGRMIREIYRVLKKDGLAFVGGGYGKNTPQALIGEIAEKSRILNDRLGRKKVTVGDLKNVLNKSTLSGHARIETEGGLWLVIRKNGKGSGAEANEVLQRVRTSRVLKNVL